MLFLIHFQILLIENISVFKKYLEGKISSICFRLSILILRSFINKELILYRIWLYLTKDGTTRTQFQTSFKKKQLKSAGQHHHGLCLCYYYYYLTDGWGKIVPD